MIKIGVETVECRIWNAEGIGFHTSNKSFATAICLAILKVKGVEYELKGQQI